MTESRRVILSPGGLFCGDHSFVVSTILGSCIAVCLWDRNCRRGGMNHFQLPRWDGAGEPLNYGDAAIQRLVAEIEAMGSLRASLDAKLFGGAAVLGSGVPGSTVGEKNAAAAVEILDRLGIPVIGGSVGGPLGCHIRFDLATGDVVLRRVDSPLNGPAPA
jgi:chemotaxis protein CheD